MKTFEIFKNGTEQGVVNAKNKKEAEKIVFTTYGEDIELHEVLNLSKNEIKKARGQHQKIREIMEKYGNPEYGDCIIDEICFLFGQPTTTDTEPEDY